MAGGQPSGENKRDQFLRYGAQHPEQLDSVLAEFKEQHIKAAKGTKVANAMAKKQGSVGQDEEAVAIAWGAGEVVAGTAVAGEAGEVAAGSAVAWGGRAICCLVRRCMCR